MTTKPPTSGKPPKANKPPAAPKINKPGPATRAKKTFEVVAWDASGHGEKIVLYGKSGVGKTTLASLAPKPVFIGLDDGGRKILRPDGTPLQCISGVTSVPDLLDLLRQPSIFDPFDTVVLDNLTKLEEVAESYVVENYRTTKGQKVTSYRGFGWDGPPHMLDTFRLILNEFDPIVARGKNVVLLAQVGHKTVENPDGADYLEAGPALTHQKHASIRDQVCQWADHVFRLGYLDMKVEVHEGAKTGKVTSADATRAVYCGGAQHFIAKSRPIRGLHLPPVISFEGLADDTLWQGIADPSIFGEE